MNTQQISKKGNPVAKAMITLYGIICYLLFFPTFCYFVAFTGGILVPKTVDTGVDTPLLLPKFIPGLKSKSKVVHKPVVR